MTRQGLLRSPPVNRCQPLLTDEKPVTIPRERRRVGEMAGGTAAECAAICCCCPCTVMNLLVLAVYKVPAGLCRKAMRRKKRQRIAKKRSKSLLRHRPSDASGSAGGDAEAVTTLEKQLAPDAKKENDATAETADLEKKMWAQFYGAGFWRSTSRRDP